MLPEQSFITVTDEDKYIWYKGKKKELIENSSTDFLNKPVTNVSFGKGENPDVNIQFEWSPEYDRIDMFLVNALKYIARDCKTEVDIKNILWYNIGMQTKEVDKYLKLIDFENIEKKTNGYLLISTDGFSISTKPFKTYEEAYDIMEDEYSKMLDNVTGSECRDMCGISSSNATLYNDGEGVYVWEIVEK